MVQRIDARGLECPEPVVLAKKALETMGPSGDITVIVDEEVSRDNIIRMARNSGFAAEVIEERDGDIYVSIRKGEGVPQEEAAPVLEIEEEPGGDTVIFMRSEDIGRGVEELGKTLTKTFLYTLTESAPKPTTIVLMHGAVKLVLPGSPVFESLRELSRQGVDVIVCGLCVDYYNIKGQTCVGRVSNMYEIVEKFLRAKKVITV